MASSAQRVYLAQTGLVGAPGLPNHLTIFRLQPGPTDMPPGQDKFNVVFEAGEAGGVVLRKTLGLTRGSHLVSVRHEIRNAILPPRPRDTTAPAWWCR